MTIALHKTKRLPLWAAAFIVAVCVAILGMSGVREWTSRAASLQAAEVDLANLARSLTQHAEDSFDLLDASIVGVVSRLEVDGIGPATLSTLRIVILARKASLKRIHDLVILDEKGDWLVSSSVMGPNLGDREYFRRHLQSTVGTHSSDILSRAPSTANGSRRYRGVSIIPTADLPAW
jgi:hypothetical protein